MFLNQMTPNHQQTLNEEVHCTVILTIEYMYFPFFSMQSLMMKVNVCNQSLETQITMLQLYTCQLFLRYRREIFILGVLGFLKTTRSFPKIPEEFRSLPKKSEVFRRCPKSSKFAYCDESENSPRISQSQS